MSGSPLRFVLGLLRRIKSGSDCGMGHSALNHVEVWATGGGQEAQFKILMSVQTSLIEAREVISKSGMSEEAKIGLFATIDSLAQAFSLGGMQSALSNFIPSIDTSLTIFAVVASAVDFDVPEGFREERDALVEELQLFIQEMGNFDIDERLRDTARKQISLLIALLKNAEAVGVEVALAAYYEMILKIRNRSASDANEKSEDRSKFWSKIRSWSERLDSLTKIYDVGQRLLPYVDKIPQIPGF